MKRSVATTVAITAMALGIMGSQGKLALLAALSILLTQAFGPWRQYD